ncbi:uncharacterized protein LOC144324684 [Canis aureus]
MRKTLQVQLSLCTFSSPGLRGEDSIQIMEDGHKSCHRKNSRKYLEESTRSIHKGNEQCSLKNNWQIWNACSVRTHIPIPAFREKWPQNWRSIPQSCRFGSRTTEQNSRKQNSNYLRWRSRPAIPREIQMHLQDPLMVSALLPWFTRIIRYLPSNSAYAPILRLSQTILLATI